MATKKVVIAESGGLRKVRYHLDGSQDKVPCAGTTKYVWQGPGTFLRVEYDDGSRDDIGETAKMSYRGTDGGR